MYNIERRKKPLTGVGAEIRHFFTPYARIVIITICGLYTIGTVVRKLITSRAGETRWKSILKARDT